MATWRWSLFLCTASLGVTPCFGQSTARVTALASGADATAGGTTSYSARSISADGRFVVFSTTASDLSPADTDGFADVLVFDRNFGTFELASVTSDGVKGNSGSLSPSISADGRWVVFVSGATNFPRGTARSTAECYVHDRLSGRTTRMTVDLNLLENEFVAYPDISADGRVVAFIRRPDIFTGGRIYAHDRDADQNGIYDEDGTTTTELISLGSNGAAATGFDFSLSGDGRWVALSSLDALVPEDTNFICPDERTDPNDFRSCADVYVRDRLSRTTTLVGVASSGNPYASESGGASISDNGRFVAFETNSYFLAADLEFVGQCKVRDRDTDADGIYDEPGAISTVDASLTLGGRRESARGAMIAPDGSFVVFASQAYDLVPGDAFVDCDPSPNGLAACNEIFIHDVASGRNERVSDGWTGVPAIGHCSGASVSRDGRFVAFTSPASNLVPADGNSSDDVFLRDRTTCLPGTVNAGAGAVADVLTVNGNVGSSTRVVTIAPRSPMAVSLGAAPAGPTSPRYVLWAWRAAPRYSFGLTAAGQRIGCSVNPTPLRPQGTPPLPFLCLLGGLGSRSCGAVPIHPRSPASAPWTRTRASGLPPGTILTLQGVIEDSGSTASASLSVTNAVVVAVQ